MAFLFQRGTTFHAGYYEHGIEHHVSLDTDNRKVAEKRLNALVKKSARGWAPEDEKLTFEDLIEKVRLDHADKGRKSKNLPSWAVHLRMFFGDMRAVDITSDHIKQYRQSRKNVGASIGSINCELAVLRRGFNLTELVRKPKFEMPDPKNARQDFLTWADFQAVRAELPEEMRDLITFLYLSTWRPGQVVALEWRDIDIREKTVTARGVTTKSGQAHRIALVGELWEIVERAYKVRVSEGPSRAGSPRPPGSHDPNGGPSLIPYVFHLDGHPYRLSGHSPLRKAWAKATAAAGFKGHVPYCLRRSGIRNMINGGVDPMLAMGISGHKTMAMLNRYRIISLDDQRGAFEKTQKFLAEQPSEGKVRAIGGKP